MHGVDASPGTPAMALVIWTDDVDKAYEQLKSAGTTYLNSCWLRIVNRIINERMPTKPKLITGKRR